MRKLLFVAVLAAAVGPARAQEESGLSGGFDFELEFAPESGAVSASSTAGANGTSLFTALEEQLGLKLRPARQRVAVVGIDHVEHPTEN